MTSNRDRRVVVTGLGATTPLGGTAPATWEALLAGRSGARTMDYDWVAKYELPVTFAATIATHARRGPRQGRDPPPRPVEPVRRHRRPRGVGRRRLPRDRPRAPRRRHRLRHRWRLDPPRPVGHPAGEGPPPRLPAAVPMLMPNGPAAAVSPRPRRPRRRPHDGQRLRLRHREHGLRHRHDPHRPGRRRRRAAAPRRPSTRCRSPASPRCRRSRRRNDDPEQASRPYDTRP